MKARTQAAKRAAKRGRPKLSAGMHSREANGRLSRRKERTALLEHQTIQDVATTRMRHFNLANVELAADPRRGYVLGRIFMDGKITEAQHDAGLRYGEDMARYYGLTGVRFPSARAQNLFAVRGEDGEVSETRAKMAKDARQRMTSLRAALLDTGDINTARKVLHTVNSICVEDIDQARGWPEHMIALLRNGLNKLTKHYGSN